jgi:tRNA threonylcarbamoyladenosine biosynthesis protein TsaB
MLSPSSPASPACKLGRWLLVDTSSGAARVGLSLGGDLLEHRTGSLPRGGARELPELVADWLSPNLVGVAVFLGPGSFTGIRVGIAFARGLTRARELSLAGIDGLEALAVTGPQGGSFLVACDALRGECLARCYFLKSGIPCMEKDLGRLPWMDLPPGLPLLARGLPGGRKLEREVRRPCSNEALLGAASSLLARGLERPLEPIWTRPSWAEESGDGKPGSMVKLGLGGRE